jgi:hypothetical protein
MIGFGGVQPLVGLVERVRPGGERLLVLRRDVAAGAERAVPDAGEDDDPDARVLAGALDGVDQLEQRVGAERVELLGPVDLQPRDGVVGLVRDVGVGHGGLHGGECTSRPVSGGSRVAPGPLDGRPTLFRRPTTGPDRWNASRGRPVERDLASLA